MSLLKTNGYTLIELLVSISIITILVVTGVTSYVRTTRKQVIFETVEKVLLHIKDIQTLAQTGERDCLGVFEGYDLTFTQGSSTVTHTATCSLTDSDPIEEEMKDISFNDNVTLHFYPLSQGIGLGGASSYNLDFTAADSETYRIQVTSAGLIEYLGKQ